jgi:glycerol-3-phosphate acyltransferase PlsX
MIRRASSDNLTIALDGMGGDNAPESVIEGALLALKTNPDINFIIHGDANHLEPLLQAKPVLAARSRIAHTTEVVENDDKPSFALRRRRDSSMSHAIKSVRSGDAAGAVSAGNTGALMAMAKVLLRTLPGIDRPAIGGIMPTQAGSSVMLDLGANVTCDAENLFEFAVMGDAFARIILHKENPSIGLLNIGTEDAKGNEAVKSAATMLRESDLKLNFYGHIEGNDIGAGTVDVIVTDGFTGNVALKTAEGTAKMFAFFLKDALNKSTLANIGKLFSGLALKKLKNKMNPSLYNGAMFLGLNGIIVKSHGGTDALGFANAINVTINLAKDDINKHIIDEMIQSGHIAPEDDEDIDVEEIE